MLSIDHDPMDTGIPATPAFQQWKAGMLELIQAQFPHLADAVCASAPWLEGFEDRGHRSAADMARWLVNTTCIEQGRELPMLTCEEIAERARSLSSVIGRENYEAVAAQILPRTPYQQPPRELNEAELIAVVQLPEVAEERRGQNWHTPGDDWTDLVVACVTIWQANAARLRFYAELVQVEA